MNAQMDRAGLAMALDNCADAASNPLVSIIVINHNYAGYLSQAISSARAQTYPCIEIVVVDDGSTDGSRALISALPSQIEIVLQPQSGHVSAFNAGFAAAHGDILLFLDADDWLEADCVRQVVAAWEPGLAKVQYRLNTVDAAGNSQNMPFPYFPPDLTARAVRDQSLASGFYPWTVSSGNAYSRAYLDRVMPIPANLIFKSPDGYVNKLAPLFGDVVTLYGILGNYRVHGKNSWAQSGPVLDISGITRAVRFDALLHTEFVRIAAEAGHHVTPYHVALVPQMLEYRLLSLRLGPASHPIAGDGRYRLMLIGLKASLAAPNISRLGRLTWMVWFITLGGAPAAIIGYLFRLARGQSKRAPLSRFLIRLARGSAVRAAR